MLLVLIIAVFILSSFCFAQQWQLMMTKRKCRYGNHEKTSLDIQFLELAKIPI